MSDLGDIAVEPLGSGDPFTNRHYMNTGDLGKFLT